MLMPFHKMQACGNDFVIINTFQAAFTLSEKQIQRLCDRHKGIGCDQLLLLSPSHQTDIDFIYRIFNHDGLEVSQCGNGARCVARYAYNILNIEKKILRFTNINHHVFEADMEDPTQPNIKMTEVTQKNLLGSQILPFSNTPFFLIDIGNPHAVLFTHTIDTLDVSMIGSHIQLLFPKTHGINVSFAEKISPKTVRLRIYERGVGETQACGSAACATLITGFSQGFLNASAHIQSTGGAMNVSWKQQAVHLQGEAIFVFDGTYKLSNNKSEN